MAPCSLLAITLLPLMLLTWVPMAMAEAETCFYRQHQSVTVSLRQASKPAAGATEARALQSQQACVRACCSTAVKPGARCTMVVFNANKKDGEENCFLFHCQAEQDCPLRTAPDGVSTYDIYRGFVHPTTVGLVTTTTNNGQVTAAQAMPRRPIAIGTTTAIISTTTPTISKTTPAISVTTPSAATRLQSTDALAPTPPSSVGMTTSSPGRWKMAAAAMTTRTTKATTTTTMKKTVKITRKQNKMTKKTKPVPVAMTTWSSPTPLPVHQVGQDKLLKASEPPWLNTQTTAVPPTSAAGVPPSPPSSPSSTSSPLFRLSSSFPSSSSSSPSHSSPHPFFLPPLSFSSSSSSSSPSSTSPSSSSLSSSISSSLSFLSPSYSSSPSSTSSLSFTSSTSSPSSTLSSSSSPSSSLSTPFSFSSPVSTSSSLSLSSPSSSPSSSSPLSPADSTFSRSSSSLDLLLIPTDGVQSSPAFRSSGTGEGWASPRKGTVVMVVLALAVLTLALAVGGRKAMESFDRRHYTRLELNELHYEV